MELSASVAPQAADGTCIVLAVAGSRGIVDTAAHSVVMGTPVVAEAAVAAVVAAIG